MKKNTDDKIKRRAERYLQSKIFILLILCLTQINFISAYDFDNSLSYSNNDLKVELNNWFGLGTNYGSAELKSHKSVDEVLKVGLGNQVVMYYDFNFNELYKDGLGKVYFTDMRTGKEIERDFRFVYWGEEEYQSPVYFCSNVLSKNGTISNECEITSYETKIKEKWLPYNSKDIPKGNLRIGIETEVKINDYIDGIWTIAGKKITKHATWTESLNVDLVEYFTFNDNKTSGVTTIGDLGNGGTLVNGVTTGATGKLGEAYSFNAGDSEYVTLNSSLQSAFDGDFTVSFWVYNVNAGSIDTFFDSSLNSGDYKGLHIYKHSTTNYLYSSIDLGGSARNILTNKVLKDGYWYHIVYVRDGTNVTLWLNGTNVGNDDSAGNDADISNADTIKIGTSKDVTNYFHDGTIDEVAIWEKALTNDEVSDLYNNGDGLGYNQIMMITLLSPEDYYNSVSQDIDFSANVSDEYTLGIENVSLYIDGVINQTNSSGVEGIYNWSLTLGDGDYNWSVKVVDSTNNETFESSTRYFAIDTTAPTIDVISPTGNYNYLYEDYNLTLNTTINDTNLDTCWFKYDNTNTTFSCTTETLSTEYFNYTKDVNNLTIYANDTFGFETSEFVSWNYRIFENSLSYSSLTIEGSLEEFEINITYNPSQYTDNVNLIYNGTLYPASTSQTGNTRVYSKSIDIPLVTSNSNLTFYWNFILDDGTEYIINSPNYNQTVSNIAIGNCTEYSNAILILTLLDEELQTLIEPNQSIANSTIEVSMSIYDYFRTTKIANFSTSTVENPYSLCLNLNATNKTNLLINSIIKYTSEGYAKEYYNIKDLEFNEDTITQNINLYALNSSDSTEFKISLTGSNSLPVEDALIYIDRQYISEDVFKTVEVPLSDSNGETVGHFVRNDIVYNIRAIKDGTVIVSLTNVKAFCEDYTIGSCEITLNGVSTADELFNYNEELGIIYDSYPTYNDTLNEVTFGFTSSNGESKTINMLVERQDIFGNRSICNDTLTSSSGTLSCSTPSPSETTFEVKIYVDGNYVNNFIIDVSDNTPYGTFGYIVWFFLTLIIILITNDKSFVLIGTALAYIGAVVMGAIEGDIIGFASAGIWILIITILGVWKINKENPQ